MPSYIDLGEVVKGFTGAAQAVGALSDLNRKLTYGDREYQAELTAKENQAAMGELSLKKAQEEEARVNMDNLLNESRARAKKFDEDSRNAGLYNVPLPTDSVKQGMMVVSSNPRLTEGIKRGITDRNWADVEEFNTIASDNFNRAGKILRDGKVDPAEYEDVKVGYIATRKYNDPSFKLKSEELEVAMDGVYQLNSKGERVAKIENTSPFQLAQGMQYQAKAASSIRNEVIRQYGTDNYSKFSKDTQKGIDIIQQFQSLKKQLPQHLADQVDALYQFGTIDHLEKNSIPAIEKMITDYNNTTNVNQMKAFVGGQQIKVGNKTMTVDEALKNTKDPQKYMEILNSATQTAFNTPKGKELAQQYGFTPDSIVEKMAASKVKGAEQLEKMLKPAETIAGINLKKAEADKARRTKDTGFTKADLSKFATSYDTLQKNLNKMTNDFRYVPGGPTPEQKAQVEQTKARLSELENVLKANNYPGFSGSALPTGSPQGKTFTSPFK